MPTSVGAAINGTPDPEEEQPLQNIVTSATQNPTYKALFDDPNSRSALLQIGLNLMQPTAMGQTTGGHIAQAVGSGGEAVGRIEEGDIKQQVADTKLQTAERLLAAANQRGPDGLTPYQRLQAQAQSRRDALSQTREERAQSREERMAQAAENAEINKELTAAEATRDDLTIDDTDPRKAPYVGKTRDQLRAMIIAARGGTTTGAPTGAPTGAVPPAPPANQRVTGQVYQTPRGPLKWLKSGDSFGWGPP